MDIPIYFYLMTAVVGKCRYSFCKTIVVLNVVYAIKIFFISIGKRHSYQTDIDASRNSSTGIITSPGYPGNYLNNAAYKWTLKTGNRNATVSVNFQDFDIKKMSKLHIVGIFFTDQRSILKCLNIQMDYRKDPFV